MGSWIDVEAETELRGLASLQLERVCELNDGERRCIEYNKLMIVVVIFGNAMHHEPHLAFIPNTIA